MECEGHKFIFTTDWFSGNAPVWLSMLHSFIGKPDVRVLEIGSFQGRSAVWVLQHIATHETATMTCIDTFEGSVENSEELCRDLWDIFNHNISPFKDKVTIHRGYSQTILRSLPEDELFDIMYIDGDHAAPSVLEDAVLAWRLLKIGGIMIFDDYEWSVLPNVHDRPKLAIDAFIQVFAERLHIVHMGYQLAVQKLC